MVHTTDVCLLGKNFFLATVYQNLCSRTWVLMDRQFLFQVMHSQRLNDPPLKCWIIAKPTGTVISAHCLCMAGLGEACSQIGALLFAIDHTVRHKNDDDKEGVSVTQKLYYWTPPPTLKKCPTAQLMRLIFPHRKRKPAY